MAVKMLNPLETETMIDTASGSCGFPIHTVFYVWKKIYEELNIPESHLFTAEEKHPRALDYVREKVFGIDFDEKSVRVSRMLNIIAGDGHTNVLNLNSLDYERWDENYLNPEWLDIYSEGWNNFKKVLKNKKAKIVSFEEERDGKIYVKEKHIYECRDFEFDVLLANPPFAGDIKESRILAKYELSKNSSGKTQNKIGRDILFIERNLDMLKPGGRMAVVLPQGRFNNSSDKYIRDFIAERCRILAVVGLHGNVFKPHTGTKTSVLFVQKWDDTLCPKVEDYPIFFATMREPSKDNSGEKIYIKEKKIKLYDWIEKKFQLFDYDEYITRFGDLSERIFEVDGHIATSTPEILERYKLDHHDHLIIKHDLYNHDGLTQDGIAEAFSEFAKKEGLSFYPKS